MWCSVPEIWSMMDRIFLSFWAIFCPSKNPKNQNFEKMKKNPGDIIILHKYIKNHDHILHCSWDTMPDGYNSYFSFWAIFCTFSPLTTQKIKILHKWRKHLEISSFYTCTKNNDHMMYGSWNMVCNGWTDRKKDIERWVPHLRMN